jgi:hypothetical protein
LQGSVNWDRLYMNRELALVDVCILEGSLAVTRLHYLHAADGVSLLIKADPEWSSGLRHRSAEAPLQPGVHPYGGAQLSQGRSG